MDKFIPALKGSIPYILVVIGVVLIFVCEFINFTSGKHGLFNFTQDKVIDAFIGLGKIILVSGITTITLNSIKYLGIFKDELADIIYDTRFLSMRKDLPEVWERVTKELLKDKFPLINSEIMADVKNRYLPVESVNYFDKYWQNVSIKLIDKTNELVEVVQHTKFTIILADNSKPFNHPVTNTILTGGIAKNCSYILQELTINGVKIKPSIESLVKTNELITKFNVTLTGSKSYDIDMLVKKTYCLKHDNIIGQVNSFIRRNSVLKFQLSGVKLNFLEVGTLKSFQTNIENDSLIEKEYVGLIYPKQGYMAIIKKK